MNLVFNLRREPDKADYFDRGSFSVSYEELLVIKFVTQTLDGRVVVTLHNKFRQDKSVWINASDARLFFQPTGKQFWVYPGQ
jgi:hypothetical protein